MNKDAKIPMLLDVYGKILPKAQFESIDLYYNQDLSLAEIGIYLGKSRQGIYDSIRRAELTLNNLENRLGLMAKFYKIKKNLNQVKHLAFELEAELKLEKSINPEVIISRMQIILNELMNI